MRFKEIILQLPYENFRQSRFLMIATFLTILVATFYPSDMQNDYSIPRNGKEIFLVKVVDGYLRYTNTVLPILTTIVLRDFTGMKQLIVIGVSTTLSTHIPKYALNNVEIFGTRLGQRPSSKNHNMPSGHSSEASMGAFFMMRRYSKWFGIILLPILILTMYSRYMLNLHTASATIAGAFTGLLMVLMFSSKISVLDKFRFKS